MQMWMCKHKTRPLFLSGVSVFLLATAISWSFTPECQPVSLQTSPY